MSRYCTEYLPDGSVNQAGMRSSDGLPYDRTLGYLAHGIIVQLYYTDDASWGDRGWAKTNPHLAADVRIFGTRNRVLQRVPILQQIHGVHDEDTYIPRAAAQDITGAALASDGASWPTEAQHVDGDWVLVAFIGNDPKTPVILPFGLPHPAAARRPTQADGRKRRIRHNGTLIEWDSAGNLTIDASEAAQNELGASGSEQATGGGTITIKTGSAAVTIESSTQVNVTAGTKVSLSAPEVDVGGANASLMLTEIFNTALDKYLAAAAAAFNALGSDVVLTTSKPACSAAGGAAAAFAALQQTWVALKGKVA